MYVLKTVEEILAENAKRFRANRSDVSQRELAKTGVRRRTLQRVETGGNPRLSTLKELAKSLEVPFAELFIDQDERPKPSPKEALEVLAEALHLPKPVHRMDADKAEIARLQAEIVVKDARIAQLEAELRDFTEGPGLEPEPPEPEHRPRKAKK